MSIDIGAERTTDIDQLTDQLAIEIEELDTEILAANLATLLLRLGRG